MTKPVQIDNLEYLLQGSAQVETSSNFLVSSSKYLNHLGLRDWISTQYLRRNGPDRPTAGDTAAGLLTALSDLRDVPAIERLIDVELEINPQFKKWIDEAYLGRNDREFFAKFSPGTFGNVYYNHLVKYNLQTNIGRPDKVPESRYEFIRARLGQIHDYEHIITGGAFNSLGEVLPFFTRMSNVPKFLSPELGHAFNLIQIFGGFRFVLRTGVNYPHIWPFVLDLVQRGLRIGTESDAIFMARFEDVLDLSPVDAREALGVRHAEDTDTEAASAVFNEEASPQDWVAGARGAIA